MFPGIDHFSILIQTSHCTMAESTTSSNPTPDDMHWDISYLREDIQDVRQEIRALHLRID
jgi:hypothetical protein